LTWRFTGIATGVAAFVAGHRRYRSRLSGVGQLGVAVCESAWLARRVWRTSRWRQADATVDALTAMLTLAWGRFNLEPDDRRTWLNWVPWSFAANAVTVQAIGVDRLTSAATGGTAIAGANATVNPKLTDIVASTGAMAAFFVGSRLFARQIRGGAARLEAAQADAVRAGVELAAERERAAQLRVLHDGALQTLEAVGSGRYQDMAAIRAEAQAEAGKLRREMDGLSITGETFIEGIDAMIRDHIRLGLDVELHVDPVAGPSARVARALRDACNEALVNVRKHAGTDRATVEVRRSGTGLEVIVADRGRGFDSTQVPAGFGRAESIAARLAAVGGKADVISVPGAGTTVTLWGPR